MSPASWWLLLWVLVAAVLGLLIGYFAGFAMGQDNMRYRLWGEGIIEEPISTERDGPRR